MKLKLKRIPWKRLAIELKDAYGDRDMMDEKWLKRFTRALKAVEQAQARKR